MVFLGICPFHHLSYPICGYTTGHSFAVLIILFISIKSSTESAIMSPLSFRPHLQFHWGITDQQNCNIFKVYSMTWYTYTLIPTVKSTHPLLHSYFFVEGLKSLLVNSKYTILYDNYTKTACSPNVWAPHTAAMLTSPVLLQLQRVLPQSALCLHFWFQQSKSFSLLFLSSSPWRFVNSVALSKNQPLVSLIFSIVGLLYFSTSAVVFIISLVCSSFTSSLSYRVRLLISGISCFLM